MKTIYQLRKDIVEIGRRVYNRGYVAANDGNISVRIDDSRILITPTGVSKGFMAPEDMAVCDLRGNPIGRGPVASSEVHMHLKIYEMRQDVHGIVHAHPQYATAFGVSGIPLTQAMLPEVIISLGGIPLAEYGAPGTEALFQPLLKHLDAYDAFLLQNHGALAIGKDLMSAYFRMETLEHCAQITFISHLLGNIQTLSPMETEKLLAMRKQAGLPGEFTAELCSARNAEACAILSPDQSVLTRVTRKSEPNPMSREVLDQVVARVIRKLELDFPGEKG